jgi:hypothetical protein
MSRRVRVRVSINKVIDDTRRRRSVFGELVKDIMQEKKVSWDEAKSILKMRSMNIEMSLV